MADKPTVGVKSGGGSKYEVSYKMYAPGGAPKNAQTTTRVKFTATVGSTEYYDESREIPGEINIKGQKTNGDTHVLTVECSTDPTLLLESRMADKPTVTVKPLGGSKYEVSYKMCAPGAAPKNAQTTTRVKFTATVGSTEVHDESREIPGEINIKGQKTNGDTHVLTVEYSTDPSEYFQ